MPSATIHISHRVGRFRVPAAGQRDWKICLSSGLWGFLAALQSWERHVQKRHWFLTRDTGSQALRSTQSRRFTSSWSPQARLLVLGFFFSETLFRSFIWVVSTEPCKVLASSHTRKSEFYFAKMGQNVDSSLSHGTEVPLLIISPNRAFTQREDVLEYPLFLDEYRASPICHLSTDTSPSLMSTCSQPPFVTWK